MFMQAHIPRRFVRSTALFLIALFILPLADAYAAAVTRGPYLQMGTSTAVTVRWRTDVATDSRVNFGTAQGSLAQHTDNTSVTTNHEVRITGLNPLTRYYYSVGSTTQTLTGDDANTYFETGPQTGTANATRIWVIGDAGTNTTGQTQVYNAYRTWTGTTYTDLWLMLGDNAYNSGTDSEYQTAMFNKYPELLRQAVVWSTLGNHDGASADSASQTGPYYDIFTLPRNAEAGGVASGTEAYYSFNYGNIHFIVLDSYETSRATNGAMMTWMQSDLQNTTAEWIIAFWHHPPYSKGSHNSDTESNLIDMRTNFLPVLESYGVDLVLGGHSHAYERSKFIDGHYGLSSTYSAAQHNIDGGSGRVDGTGAYTKAGSTANAGAVYTVAGASGQADGGSLNHPAMYLSLNELGSLVLDVDGSTLNATYLNNNGTVRDYFTISKGTPPPPTIPAAPSALGASAPTATSVALNWTDNANNETNFELDRSFDGVNWTLLTSPGVNSTVHTDNTVQATTTYYYRVRAVNSAGASTYSNTVSVTTPTVSTTTTVDLQNGLNGYAGNVDSYVASGKTTTNYGNATILLADGADGNNGREMAVLAWSVSGIPTSAIVQSAKVTLQVSNRSTGTYKLYALNKAWSEGSVTWSNLDPLNNTGVEIGSFVPNATGSWTVTLNSAGISLVQSWISGGANNGIIIRDATTTDGVDIRSSEYGTAAQRPKLTVTYQ